MDLLNITLEELYELKAEKAAIVEAAKAEYHGIAALVEEKIKLDKLKGQLNGVSLETIKTLVSSMTLSPGGIDSTESTVQS